MSGGGHFNSYWLSRKKNHQYFPQINQRGSLNLSPFLFETNIAETDKSLDPLLVSKPNQTHNSTDTVETQRVIHTR